MSGRLFLNTNIFLYGHDRDDPRKSKIAEDLIDRALLSENGFVSHQVLHEFVSVALKKFPAVMSDVELRSYIAKVFRRLEIVGPSFELIERALDLHSRYKLNWYDSLIVAAALEAKCDILYTEDLQHGQRFGSACGEQSVPLRRITSRLPSRPRCRVGACCPGCRAIPV